MTALLVGGVCFAPGVWAQDTTASYGHRAYREVGPGALRSVGTYRKSGRTVELLAPAAAAFDVMQAAAAADTVQIIPISGFRTFVYVRDLFNRAIQRHGTPERAARWVAPPGYSEHHTGLAIDIGDADAPACDAEACFATTRAGAWLRANAQRFGFELSFPDGNGAVSYEPWHFRYVGDDRSRAVFRTPA
jgi:D-alanyl-D-alanine carboxypeptidase